MSIALEPGELRPLTNRNPDERWTSAGNHQHLGGKALQADAGGLNTAVFRFRSAIEKLYGVAVVDSITV